MSNLNPPQYFHPSQHNHSPQTTVMPSNLWQHSPLPIFQQWKRQQEQLVEERRNGMEVEKEMIYGMPILDPI